MDELKILIATVLAASPAVILIYIFLLHPEKADLWASILFKVVSAVMNKLGVATLIIEKRRVGASIEARLNLLAQDLNDEVPGAMPHLARIQWVTAETADTYLSDGIVVVPVSSTANPEESFVLATLSFLQRGFLPRARPYIDPLLLKASDYVIARRIFDSDRSSGANQFFVDNVLKPATDTQPTLIDDVRLLDNLETQGLFSRIFLNELQQLGERMQPMNPSSYVLAETRRLGEFLNQIATKPRETDVPLHFEGYKINVALILVARREVLNEFGVDAYLKRLVIVLKRGCNSIYMAARGERNIEALRAVIRRADATDVLTVLDVQSFTTPATNSSSAMAPALIAVCTSNSQYLQRHRSLTIPVEDACRRVFPEFYEAPWDIVSIERRGAVSKIAVRIRSNPDETRSSLRALLGKRRNDLTEMRAILGGESVYFIPWSPDPKRFITDALTLSDDQIVSISLDESARTATVAVPKDLVGRAVGRDGANVRTASELTGWYLEIIEALLPDDEEVLAFLKRVDPEVLAGEVDVITVAREKGVGLKVVVKGNGAMLEQDLIFGRDGQRIARLREAFPGEWVNIITFDSDPARMILRALYPLTRSGIESISFDASSMRATVTTLSEGLRNDALGEGFANIRLAQRATGANIDILVTKVASLESKVRGALKLLIPELGTGDIELKRIACLPGVGAKIGVAKTKALSRTLSSICMGSNGERLIALRQKLEMPAISFVEWHDNPETLIPEALQPLSPRAITNTEFDFGLKTARIEVVNRAAAGSAIGSGARNLRLAEELTGWRIKVVAKSQ